MSRAKTFYSDSLVDAWKLGATQVSSAEGAGYVMVISAGVAWSGTADQRQTLDAAANASEAERPSGVADVLLPKTVHQSAAGHEDAIEAGLRVFGRARRMGKRLSGWTHTYFERLVGRFIDKAGRLTELKPDRLTAAIEKLNEWGRNSEASFYIHTDHHADKFRPLGSPCLQYVQFRAYGDRKLQLVALYRSHDYMNKALGNMMGLQRLGQFVAFQTEREYTGLSVVSLHPFSDGGKARLRSYVARV